MNIGAKYSKLFGKLRLKLVKADNGREEILKIHKKGGKGFVIS